RPDGDPDQCGFGRAPCRGRAPRRRPRGVPPDPGHAHRLRRSRAPGVSRRAPRERGRPPADPSDRDAAAHRPLRDPVPTRSSERVDPRTTLRRTRRPQRAGPATRAGPCAARCRRWGSLVSVRATGAPERNAPGMSSYVVSTSALRAPGEDVSGGDAPGAIGLGESGAGGIVHRARERSLLCRGLPQDGTQDTEMTLMQVMPSAPDADLFEAVQADREGWQALAFERYRAAVTSLVRRQFRGQPDDVDDIVAEAFLRFLERASRVR